MMVQCYVIHHCPTTSLDRGEISVFHKIKVLTPFDCEAYWKTVTEQCKSCYDADMTFGKWAKRASTTGGQTALAGNKGASRRGKRCVG